MRDIQKSKTEVTFALSFQFVKQFQEKEWACNMLRETRT